MTRITVRIKAKKIQLKMYCWCQNTKKINGKKKHMSSHCVSGGFVKKTKNKA